MLPWYQPCYPNAEERLPDAEPSCHSHQRLGTPGFDLAIVGGAAPRRATGGGGRTLSRGGRLSSLRAGGRRRTSIDVPDVNSGPVTATATTRKSASLGSPPSLPAPRNSSPGGPVWGKPQWSPEWIPPSRNAMPAPPGPGYFIRATDTRLCIGGGGSGKGSRICDLKPRFLSRGF